MRRQPAKRHFFVSLDRPASRAPHQPEVSVQLDRVSISGPVMQAVHVLRNQRKGRRTLGRLSPLELHQRQVPCVRPGLPDHAAPPIVPLPDQARVFRKRFGRGELFRGEVPPEAIGSAKSRNAAFGRDSRARQCNHRHALLERLTELGNRILHNTSEAQMKNHLKLTSLCPTAKACQSSAVGQLPVSALSVAVAPRCSESGKISSECVVIRPGWSKVTGRTSSAVGRLYGQLELSLDETRSNELEEIRTILLRTWPL